MSLEIYLIVFALLLSAFFAGSETAFTTAGRLTLEVLKRHGRRGANSAELLYSRPTYLFSTTLVGNNLANVLYSSAAAVYLQHCGVNLLSILIISPVVLLVLGEILPKSMAREYAEKWCLLSALPLRAVHYILFPLVAVARFSSMVFLRLFGIKDQDRRRTPVSLAEMQAVWRNLTRSGSINEKQVEMLNRAVALRESKVVNLMTPRSKMMSLPLDTSVEEATRFVLSTGFSRIPVFRGNKDHIVGILRALELLQSPEEITSILHNPLFVPSSMSARKLMKLFQENKSSIAIVVDEYGGTEGLITMEDLLEELVGGIRDEYDSAENVGKELAKGVLLLPARSSIESIRSRWNINLPEGKYESLGGLLLDYFGYIPEAGESLKLDHYTLIVATADERRVKQVMIRY